MSYKEQASDLFTVILQQYIFPPLIKLHEDNGKFTQENMLKILDLQVPEKKKQTRRRVGGGGTSNKAVCPYPLTRGSRQGQLCERNPKSGSKYCSSHYGKPDAIESDSEGDEEDSDKETEENPKKRGKKTPQTTSTTQGSNSSNRRKPGDANKDKDKKKDEAFDDGDDVMVLDIFKHYTDRFCDPKTLFLVYAEEEDDDENADKDEKPEDENKPFVYGKTDSTHTQELPLTEDDRKLVAELGWKVGSFEAAEKASAVKAKSKSLADQERLLIEMEERKQARLSRGKAADDGSDEEEPEEAEELEEPEEAKEASSDEETGQEQKDREKVTEKKEVTRSTKTNASESKKETGTGERSERSERSEEKKMLPIRGQLKLKEDEKTLGDNIKAEGKNASEVVIDKTTASTSTGTPLTTPATNNSPKNFVGASVPKIPGFVSRGPAPTKKK